MILTFPKMLYHFLSSCLPVKCSLILNHEIWNIQEPILAITCIVEGYLKWPNYKMERYKYPMVGKIATDKSRRRGIGVRLCYYSKKIVGDLSSELFVKETGCTDLQDSTKYNMNKWHKGISYTKLI